jgi:exportin-1
VQVKILSQLIGVVKEGMVHVPLWPEGQAYPSNANFVQTHLVQLLATSFPNMTDVQVQHVVARMFELTDFTEFKNHCRDFLVQTKQFGSTNNEELFAEEAAAAAAARAAAVPGLLRPDLSRDGDDMGMDN